MRTQVWFNGEELTRYAVVSGWETALLPREVSQRAVPGMDGAIYTGARLTERTITVRMALTAHGVTARQSLARALAATLATESPAPLRASIDGGIWYMAVASSTPDMTRMVGGLAFDVTFTCLDPVAHGTSRTVTVPSGGGVTFTVGGTYPTAPTISAPEAANDGTTGFWALRLTDVGDYMNMVIPTNLQTAPIVADCAARTLTVNGNTTALRPESDWLLLAPGEHTLDMVGTGEATVTFDERWL